MTPDEYCQQKAAQSGSSFYYSFLFLPRRAPPRHHRALRLLPRGRRHRRRGERRGRRAHQARLVAHRGREPLRGPPAAPGDAGTRALHQALRPRRRAPERDHRRHGDGSHAPPLRRLRGAQALLPPRRRRRRPAVGRDLRLHAIPRRSSTPRASASPSSSPTSSATWARTRAATASTCRRTNCAQFGVTAEDILARNGGEAFGKLMAFQAERAESLLRRRRSRSSPRRTAARSAPA